MPNSKIPSPARSQGVISTPRRLLRRTRSVSSLVRTNLRLSSIIESHRVSPLPTDQSVLNDDTDIEMPRRKSWWKKIDDNSRDVLELLESKETVEVNNVAEEFDVEILSQERKNYTLDLPESSDTESINSIVIPQKKLFTQKDNQPQINFGELKNNRETLQKLNKSYVDQDKEFNIKRKTLFNQLTKPRTKPVFPAALLDISANKTANKTKELPTVEEKRQVRSLFGSRPGTKRKNMFADFIVSESEDEISDIQPKVFGFQKRNEPKGRVSLMSQHSPRQSIDLEMDDWVLLPSSTMVENQIDEPTSPVKRLKLSDALESKDSNINTNSNNKTIQANKSVSSKTKTKSISIDKSNDINITPRNMSTKNSRVTRSVSKSLRENSITATNISQFLNNSKNQTQNRTDQTINKLTISDCHKTQEKQNMLIDNPDHVKNFILEYDNDDNEVVLNIGDKSLHNYSSGLKDKTGSNLNVLVEDKNNLLKDSIIKISKANFVENHQKSVNKICENETELLNDKEIDIESHDVSNYSKGKNNTPEMQEMVELKEDTNVQKFNENVEKDKNKKRSIRNSVQNYNKSSDSSHHLHDDNPEHLEMQPDSEQHESDDNSEHNSDVDDANDSKQCKPQDNKNQIENVINKQTKIIQKKTYEKENEIKINNQQDNIGNKTPPSLPNVSHDTTGRNRKNNTSPETILHNKIKQIDSFTAQRRNTSVRKTKSIIFHNKLETVLDFRKSTGFSDETGNSSAEGSGWDSHRTTRKTLRQTFGKDFTPRKSLRALVMEKTAKLQANFTEIENIKMPQANSTEYDHVEDELNSYQEMELEQVGQNIEIIQVDKCKENIQIKGNQQDNLKDVMEPLEDRDKTGQLEERNETESFKEIKTKNDKEVEQSESLRKNELGQYEGTDQSYSEANASKYNRDREDMEQFENDERDGTEPFEGRKDLEDSEEREELEEAEERDELKESEEREKLKESEEKEELEESEVREELEEAEERDELKESEEREKLKESEEREELEESEVREELEESEVREELEESEEREELEESEEREELEESDEREEFEHSEESEELEHSEEREDLDVSEGEEMEESKEREELEEPEEKEEMNQSVRSEETEHSIGVEVDQSENEDRDETEQFEDEDEIEQSEIKDRDQIVQNDDLIAEVSDDQASNRTRQTSLETYLQKIKQDNTEKRRKMQEELRNSLKNPRRDTFNLFKIPQRPVRTLKIQKPKAKQLKAILPLGILPSEVIEDMKYKPPKRFQPNNASWITKRLYKFLENKLESKYDYKARIRAEKLVQCIYNFTKEVRRHDSVRSEGIEELKREMARLDIVKTHFDFYEFCHEFLPREIRVKIVPDIVNNIQLPRHGVFSDILR